MTLTTTRWEAAEAFEGPLPGGKTGPQRRSRRRWVWALLITLAVVASTLASGVGSEPIIKGGGAESCLELFRAAAHPRLDVEFLILTVNAALTTLAYAVLGTALSLVIGIIGGVLGSRVWWWSARRSGRTGWGLARAILVVPRGIHEVVWGLFFLAVFGLDPIVAVLAIGIPFGAVTAKVFSELLDETDRTPYTALLAVGAGRRSAILYGLLPAAMSDLLSYGFYRFECAIRSAAILGLVGAGGLGFQLALSFQTLRYGEIWTLLYALILLGVAADYWSSAVRLHRTRDSSLPLRRDPVLAGSLLSGAVLIGLSTWWIGLDAAVLWSGRAWESAIGLLVDTWPPHLEDGGVGGLLELAAVTVAMSILAIIIAFAGGALLAFPAATACSSRRGLGRGGQTLLRLVSRLVLVVLRAIPPPIWALLFLFVLFPGIVPGALALAVYTAGVLGRLMAETAENLDDRPLRALRAQGASSSQVFCYGVLPAATPRFVAYGLYRWEVTVRDTVVVGVVGAGGLGVLLDHQLASFDYGGAVTTLAALIILTFAVDLTSAAVRRALR
jgi:phosphonate transport system permease protein